MPLSEIRATVSPIEGSRARNRCRVGDEVHGEGGYAGGSDDTPDREHGDRPHSPPGEPAPKRMTS